MTTAIADKDIVIKDNLVVRDLMAIDKIKSSKVNGEALNEMELSIEVIAYLISSVGEITEKEGIKDFIGGLSIKDFTVLSEIIENIISPKEVKKNEKTSSTPTQS